MQELSRWKILALVVFMQALVIGTGIYCFGFFVVHWMNDFSSQRSELMLAFTAMVLLSGIMSPIAGMWIDRYSSRTLILIGITTYSLGLLFISQASGHWMIVGVYACVLPLAMSFAGPLMSQSLVANAFTGNRGLALGICALGSSIGGFSMPMLVTYLLELYHWRQVFLILAVLIGAGLFPTAFFVLKHLPKSQQIHTDGHKALTTKQLLQDKDVYKLALAYFVPSMLFVGVLQNIGLHATDLSISQQQAGLIVSMGAVLMAVGKFVTGWLADRISYASIYYVLILLVASSLYLTATASSFVPLAIGTAVLGAAAGGVSPLISTVTAHRYGTANFGRVMGLMMSSASLSGVAPLIAGWLRDYYGSYEYAFMMFIPLVIPAIIAFKRLSKIPPVVRQQTV
jgi:MFS family permease